MIGAITHSCNVYFYQLARKVGLEAWSETCAKMGFGVPTGIDLYGEVSGTLPSDSFYEKAGVAWSPGMILNLAIGQGENSVTPLQLAHYVGIIATGGIDARPHLIRELGDAPSRVQGISEHSFAVVREGMFNVVNDAGGTAKSAKVEGVHVAGKTGTAQNPHGADHKLFMGFAPYENPTVAIAVVAENAGYLTSSLAVAYAKRVLTEYFTLNPVPASPGKTDTFDESAFD